MISVIICTYNRAALLTDVLQTVCEQTLDTSEYEVIVVDNNSTDETATISASFAARYPNVRYCFEAQQGLSHARNRGWQEAEGEYIAYIDDDCKVPEGWLSAAKTVIAEHEPDVFGGPYFPFYNMPKPPWFKDEYGTNQPYDCALEVADDPDCLHGGNLFLRRPLLQSTGGFNPEFGMAGDVVAYGEETALLRTIRKNSPKTRFYYDPSVFVYHLVRKEKMNWRWLISSHFTKGRDGYHVFQVNRSNKGARLSIIGRLLLTGLFVFWDILILSNFRNRERQPYLQQYIYESSLIQIKYLGRRYENFIWAFSKNNGEWRGKN